jgi:hypothetical protein
MEALHSLAPEPNSLSVLDPGSLRDPGTRENLSGSAVRLFLKLADLWQLSVDQRRVLLGDISRQTYHNWQNGKVATLSRDQLERVSLLLGLHKGLKLLFVDDTAVQCWLKSANADGPFAGKSPLERALCGSVNDLFVVRRYVDAWRGVK